MEVMGQICFPLSQTPYMNEFKSDESSRDYEEGSLSNSSYMKMSPAS